MKRLYKIRAIEVHGIKEDGRFFVVLSHKLLRDPVKFDSVRVQQIVLKLNKLLHMADKLFGSETYNAEGEFY